MSMDDYELIDDPICDVENWGFCYENCEDCPALYDCMEVINND